MKVCSCPAMSPPSCTLVNTVVWCAYVFWLALRGVVVLIVCAVLNSAGSVAKKALSSWSELAVALSASGITLAKSSGETSSYSTGAFSSTILVGEGRGGVVTRSTTSSDSGVVLAFFGRPSGAPASTKR